jgi:predicted GH43/DUF377 family glycosyl hydrolase
MSDFKLHRLGMLMEPEPGNPLEVEGVLNPAAVRGPMGNSISFRGWSQKEITRVSELRECDSMKLAIRLVSRGLASPSSRKPIMNGGPTAAVAVRIPRVTFVEPLQRYIMSYTAFSPQGPRIALAESEDLFHWKRLGLATFALWHGIYLG